MPDCSKVAFGEDNITVGSCKLNVYKAETYEQKVCGMLNFTDETFLKDGMIFVVLQNNSNYKVYNNDAKYSPPGLPSVVIYGNSVFETSEEKFKKLNKCMFN